MTTAYTSLLGLALPVTGELSGTWGDTVNDYITQYLDSSVAGTQTISGSQTAVTLSKTTNAALSQVGSGATGSAQYNIINCTGNPASLLTITAPAQSKTYLIINATSTNQSVKIVGTGPTTGVTLIAGEKALVAWNGSDFIKVATTAAAGGSNTQVQFNNNGVLAGSANLTFNGTRLTAADLADSGLTPTRVVYSTTGGALTDSANLTFDGTNLTLGGGTANGVAYLNGSKVLTTGSALTFDGTNLTQTAGTPVFTVFESASGNNNRLILTQNSGLTTYNLTYSTATTNGHVFQIGGAEQMRLTSTGLGIGTSSPATQFVVSNAGAQGVEITGSNGSIQVYNRSTLAYGTLNFYANTIFFRTGVSPAINMALDASGNLGIGTSSPLGRLDCALTNAATNGLYFSLGGGETTRITTNTSTGEMRIGQSNAAAGNYYLTFYTTGNERLRLDTSGNLGLGVTPSTWTLGKAFQVNSLDGAVVWGYAGAAQFGNNFYYNGGYLYATTAAATRYVQSGGAHLWYTAPSGTAGNAISFTQAMTLDASGNLLVGKTSTVVNNTTGTAISGGYITTHSSSGNGTIEVGATRAAVAADIGGLVTFRAVYRNSDSDSTTIANIKGFRENATNNNWSSYLAFETTNGSTLAERARITSGGDLLVGTATAATTARIDGLSSSGGTPAIGAKVTAGAATQCFIAWNDATTGDNVFHSFYTEGGSGTLRGSIDYNRAGGLTRYNITSDYRAKDIIGPAQNTGAIIDALKVYEGVMKGATQSRPMMIAHEAQEVVPFCVSGVKDETNEDGTPKYQQMDHASLVPLLIAEIQSLRARVAQLEAK